MNNKVISPVSYLEQWAKKHPDKIFLKQPKGEQYITTSWDEAFDYVSRLANYLKKYPAQTKVAIFSGNCADWFLVDLAIMAAGHISIPIYPTASEKTVSQIIEHSETSVAFIGNIHEEFDFDIFKDCKELIAIQSTNEENNHSKATYWKDLIATQQRVADFFKPSDKDIVTIAYTSGTTGIPKGVVISYRALSAGLDSIDKSVQFGDNERFLSYLPLAHIMERMAIEMSSIRFCSEVSFVEDLSTFSRNLAATQPTVFISVPRIWLKLKQGIEDKFGGAKRFKQIIRIPFLGKFLGRKIINNLGLSNAKYSLVGAAAISVELLEWYEKLGLTILEGYGLSETLGISHLNLPGQQKIGSVGKNMSGCETKIHENGEVLLRSEIVMDGYYKNPELTAEVVKDGWFYTGDLGELDSNGFLTIKGRVKELFKTSKGKYVSPIPIEQRIEKYLSVDQVCVLGGQLTQPIAAVVMELKESDDLDALKQKLEHKLTKINNKLEAHEKIACLIISQTPWTPENERMTPTLKLKRAQIESHFQPIYQKSETKESVLLVD